MRSHIVRNFTWLTLATSLFVVGLLGENHFRELIVDVGIYADEHGTSGGVHQEYNWGWILSVLAIVSSIVIAITIAISLGKNPRSSHRNEDWSTPHE